MRRISRNSMTSAGLLIALGMAALYAGPASLLLLIPMALLVWYAAHPLLGNGRN